MRIIRFAEGKRESYGILEGDLVYTAEDPFADAGERARPFPADEVRLLAPVRPTKIIAVGLNYRAHADELNMPIPDEPVIFMKAPSSVIGPEGTIEYPRQSGRVDYEVELAAVIGSRAKQVSGREAMGSVLGYTVGLDITARDLQLKDGQWTRAKSFDSFCPLGPWVDTDVEPDDLSISLCLNGETVQSSRTSDMIFPVGYIVEFVSGVMTLMPGDVILTGTPSGVGELRPGDRIEADVEGIGVLRCGVGGRVMT